jgi:pimeloyl-ACP methyl ester carboxylesterase
MRKGIIQMSNEKPTQRPVQTVSLSYDDVGNGGDVLVLVHGHPFDRTMWRSQLDAAMRVGWRAIAPDLRGYGRSPVTPGKVTLDIFAQDIAALLDELHVERIVLCGLSMGGQIAMEFCRRFPERIRGVLLTATSPRAETDEGKRNRNLVADRLQAEGMQIYAQELLPKMLAAQTIEKRPEIAAALLRMMRKAPAEGSAAALRGRAERPGYESTLASLGAPALIVVGDQDAFTTRSDADEMHRLLVRSKLVWMEGVGHMPNLENEEAFNAELTEFLTMLRRDRVEVAA